MSSFVPAPNMDDKVQSFLPGFSLLAVPRGNKLLTKAKEKNKSKTSGAVSHCHITQYSMRSTT